MSIRIFVFALFVSTSGVFAQGFVAEGPTVYIISPSHGERVSSPVTVKFGAKGIGVAPAGVQQTLTGHHHLLIDIEEIPDTRTITFDNPKQIMHFGSGQTEVTLELPPGEHTLQLLMGDFKHTPIFTNEKPLASEKITIFVEAPQG